MDQILEELESLHPEALAELIDWIDEELKEYGDGRQDRPR